MPLIRVEFQPDRTKMVFSRWDGETKTHEQRIDPLHVKTQERLCKLLSIDAPTLLQWINTARTTPNRVFDVPDQSEHGDRTIYRRPINQSSLDAALLFPDIHSAFAGSTTEDVLEWGSKDHLCALDVDYHGVTAPPADWLTGVVEVHLKPRPFLWHFSRGGGLHLFYRPLGDLTAEDLAGIAALRFRQLDPTAGVELKKVVRGWNGEMFRLSDDTSITSVIDWVDYEGVEDKQITDWLESEGMEMGGRYPHERCPINPEGSQGNESVQVMEGGIYCHRCSGTGVSLGSRKPGWAPWSALVGRRGCGQLGSMIRNLTHWGHAKWVIRDKFRVPDDVGRVAYRAACRLYHADRPSAPLVDGLFRPETDAFARVGGRWASVDTGYEWTKDCQGILSVLPACCVVNDEGNVRPVAAKVNLFQQPTVDLSKFGYTDLEVIRGTKVYGYHLEYRQPDRLVIEVPHKRESQYGTKFTPRYLPADKRMPETEAQAVFDGLLGGGINWNYVYLILAAKGCREGPVGLNPVVLVDGMSASGKTGMVQIAAGIAGDSATEIVYQTDIEKLRQSVKMAASQGTYAVINEFIKDATHGRDRVTPVQALDPILNFTPNSVSKAMYVGPVALGQPPAMLFTEQSIPQILRAQTQIARRCVHVRLKESVRHWLPTLADRGLSALDQLRCYDEQAAQAANTLLSIVIDRWFQIPTTFDLIAKELGFATLESSPEFDDPISQLHDFYVAVCLAPEIEGPHKKRFPGRGYKMIERSDETELQALWSLMADGRGGDWMTSRILTEKDWAKELGTSEPVALDIVDDKQRVAVRFRQGSMRHPTKVNEEIVVNEELRERLK